MLLLFTDGARSGSPWPAFRNTVGLRVNSRPGFGVDDEAADAEDGGTGSVAACEGTFGLLKLCINLNATGGCALALAVVGVGVPVPLGERSGGAVSKLVRGVWDTQATSDMGLLGCPSPSMSAGLE